MKLEPRTTCPTCGLPGKTGIRRVAGFPNPACMECRQVPMFAMSADPAKTVDDRLHEAMLRWRNTVTELRVGRSIDRQLVHAIDAWIQIHGDKTKPSE